MNQQSHRNRSFAKLGVILLTAAAVIAIAPAVMACPVCYGDPNSPMAKGMNNAIIFLLGLVGVVQIGFIALFWTWWRNSAKLRKRRDEFRVLAGGVR